MSTVISLSAAEQAALAAPPDRQEIAKLYVNFLSRLLLWQDWQRPGKNCQFDRFITWECCARHRVLQLSGNELERRARAISPGSSGTAPLSQAWWANLGIAHDANATIIE